MPEPGVLRRLDTTQELQGLPQSPLDTDSGSDELADLDLTALEEARAQHARGGEPDPVAGSAEGQRDGGDDADLRAVGDALKRAGLHVEVAAFSGRTAEILKRAADQFIDLDQNVLQPPKRG